MKLHGYYLDPPHALGKAPALIIDGQPNHRHLATQRKYITFEKNQFRPSPVLARLQSAFTRGEFLYMAHVALFSDRKGQSYVFSKDFLEVLLDSEAKADIFDMFPEKWSAYVAFPSGVIEYQNNMMTSPAPLIGGYISVGPLEDIFLPGGAIAEAPKYLWYTFFSLLGENKYGLISGYLALRKDITSLEDLVAFNMSEADGDPKARALISKAAILTTLYINQAKPDLRHLKPSNQLSKSQIAGLINSGRIQEIEDSYSADIYSPVQLVSWGWKKPDHYVKDHWPVRAHFKRVGKEKRPHWFPPRIAHRNPDLLHNSINIPPELGAHLGG